MPRPVRLTDCFVVVKFGLGVHMWDVPFTDFTPYFLKVSLQLHTLRNLKLYPPLTTLTCPLTFSIDWHGLRHLLWHNLHVR
jgi:hypothetical protein